MVCKCEFALEGCVCGERDFGQGVWLFRNSKSNLPLSVKINLLFFKAGKSILSRFSRKIVQETLICEGSMLLKPEIGGSANLKCGSNRG